MIIEVKELCLVDYIKEEEEMENESVELTAIRTVQYSSPKEDLIEALQDYDDNFDIYNIIHQNDEFEGECIGFKKYISVQELI